MGMNANTIINDDMTLEEKLAAIDAAMQSAQGSLAGQISTTDNQGDAPVDPADMFMCEGCQ